MEYRPICPYCGGVAYPPHSCSGRDSSKNQRSTFNSGSFRKQSSIAYFFGRFVNGLCWIWFVGSIFIFVCLGLYHGIINYAWSKLVFLVFMSCSFISWGGTGWLIGCYCKRINVRLSFILCFILLWFFVVLPFWVIFLFGAMTYFFPDMVARWCL